MKIRPVWAELFHADGQTKGQTEATSRFSKFCYLAQKESDKYKKWRMENKREQFPPSSLTGHVYNEHGEITKCTLVGGEGETYRCYVDTLVVCAS
jgi:hypothetical protein